MRRYNIEEKRSAKIVVKEELGNGRNRYRFSSNWSMKTDSDSDRAHFKSRVVDYQWTADFISWILRSKFVVFSTFSTCMFVLLTLIFAVVILLALHFEPRCVTVGTFETSGNFSAKLNDAWQLSWTTFSTVGYGMISPSTSAKFGSDISTFRGHKCTFTNIVLSVECLVGILFISFCSAILFSKLMQFQSNAQMKFSNVMVVRFGNVCETGCNDDLSTGSNDSGLEKNLSTEKIPCPTLCFRMANLQHSDRDGEIVSAEIKVAATVDYRNAINSFFQSTEYRNAFGDKKVNNPNTSIKNPLSGVKNMVQFGPNTNAIGDQVNVNNSNAKFPRMQHSFNNIRKLVHFGMTDEQIDSMKGDLIINKPDSLEPDSLEPDSLDTLRKSINVQFEGITGSTETPNLVFANLKMEPMFHPMFKRTWRVFHTLNEQSPLLTKSARKRVQEAGGYWPADMNNVVDVRGSIDFDEILISFNGLSQSTGCDVYGHKKYVKEDLQVGYEFKSILMGNPSGTRICVEIDDIDKVQVQEGNFFNYLQARRQLKKAKSSRHGFSLKNNPDA